MSARHFLIAAENLSAELAATSAKTEAFYDLLCNLESLCHTALQYMDVEERIRFYEDSLDEIEKQAEPIITPIREVKPEPVKEEADFPPPDESPYPEVSYTLDQVKAEFTKAAQQGVKVAEVINAAGYGKLSDVPVEKYAELLAKLAEKVNS